MTKINLGLQQHFQNSIYSCVIETEVPQDITKDEFKKHLMEALETIREAIQEDAAKVISTTDIKALPAPCNNMTSEPQTTFPKAPQKAALKTFPKPASPSQLVFIKKICNERGINLREVAKQHGVQAIEEMNGKDCWTFIDKHVKK